MMKRKSKAQVYWVGIDWGHEQHAVAVVDEAGRVVREFTAPATLEGLAGLGEELDALVQVAGVSIETVNVPVFYYIDENGYTLYPVNPKLSKQWREGTTVAGSKSDARDGRVLAAELARRHETLRPFRKADPATAELAGLCEKQRALIDQRTALIQRLRATLRVYYPAALEFFNDLTAPTAWAFLKRFPNPASLAGARKDTLLRFLKAHRIGIKPVWLERIERRKDAVAWPTPPAAQAEEMMMMACVGQLYALQASLDRFDTRIAECTNSLPEARILRSLPGAGERLTPALTALVRSVEFESGGAAALRCLAGVAPVEHQSGKRRRTRIRRRCNKHWRNVMHLFAWSTTSWCRWARAFYDLCKERGNSHATALRKLADKWLRIIACLIQTGELYDEDRYIESLRKNGSPVYLRLGQQTCG